LRRAKKKKTKRSKEIQEGTTYAKFPEEKETGSNPSKKKRTGGIPASREDRIIKSLPSKHGGGKNIFDWCHRGKKNMHPKKTPGQTADQSGKKTKKGRGDRKKGLQ